MPSSANPDPDHPLVNRTPPNLDPDYVAPDTDLATTDTQPTPAPDAPAAPAEVASAGRRHPTLAPDEEVFPLADAGEFYVGLWNGYPKYGCPVCAWTTLTNNAAEGDFRTVSHIQEKAGSSPKHAALLEKKGDNA